MNLLVVDCFERRDIAVVRFSDVEQDDHCLPHYTHLGGVIGSKVTSLHVDRRNHSNMPRTAASLLYSALRFRELEADGISMNRHAKLGEAAVTAEAIDGLTIVAINYADNRFPSRQNCLSVVSLVADTHSRGDEHLQAVWAAAMDEPQGFMAAMHPIMKQGVPEGLTVGCFAMYNQQEESYTVVAGHSSISTGFAA